MQTASKPRYVRKIEQYGLVADGQSVLDFGCGDRSAKPYFEAMGLKYTGWNVQFRRPRRANIVNLSYVLNVVEDEPQRRAVTKQAFALAEDLLLVTIPACFRLWDTDITTTESTRAVCFQRVVKEICRRNRAWIRDVVGNNVTAISPDVFFCTRGEATLGLQGACGPDCYAPSHASDLTSRRAIDPVNRRGILRLASAVAGIGLLTISNKAHPGVQYTSDHECVAEQNTFERVRSIVKDHLGIESSRVVPQARFMEDLDADSLDKVELMMAIEEEFGIEVPDEVADRIMTVDDAVRYIDCDRP